MAVGVNNIYPPVVSPYSPNFVIGSEKGCRVYFSISAYNSISEYKDVQITVTRQSDNITALSKTNYPSQIMIKPAATAIQVDSERASADKYYIKINNSDIEGGFQTGIIYKVQMRFSSDESNMYTLPQKVDAYLSSHLSNFSEWSQVCLVQGINRPELQIKIGSDGFLEPMIDPDKNNNKLHIDTLEVVGTLITDDSDPLREYELLLYDKDYNLVETSGVLFPAYQSYVDQLNYVFKNQLQDGESYTLEIRYMTYGLFEESVSYPILVVLNLIESLHAHIEAIEDVENGRIGVHISSEATAAFNGKVTIRRTSSESDFKLWEDIYTTRLKLDHLEFLWYDYTVKSGVWYKYCIQKRDENNNRGIVSGMKEPAMIVMDDIFLVADNQQVRIQFDPQVTTFSRIVNDSKVDTIGSKYPYIRRNGPTEYRQFQLSGLISFLMDDYNIFLSREEYYGDNLKYYQEYNEKERITDYNEITWERDYREKIMDFLYKHNVKLFKSATEGNILVKLMDISFTPNRTLGRRIYSFQCTAYEVAENTVANIGYYDVQTIDTTVKKTNLYRNNIIEVDSEVSATIGQWDSLIPAKKEFIHCNPQGGTYSVLEDYYQGLAKPNTLINVDNLTFLRIEMQDDPYLIYDNGVDEPQDYDAMMQNRSKKSRAYNPPTSSMRENGHLFLGYLAHINDKIIIIPQDGVYELKGDNVLIESLWFERATTAEIRYQATINETEDVVKVLSLTNFYQRLGQEWGGFIPGESLYNKLWDKYYSEHPNKYYTALVSINSLTCQANPGTVIYVREEGETLANRHVIGQTERLDFYSDESVIADAFFLGQHFEQATDYEMGRSILPEGKCNRTDIIVDSLDKIVPQDRYVYYLQSSNNGTEKIAAAAALSAKEPELVKLTTAKGLPIYTMQQEVDGELINIAIVDKFDYDELEKYLMDLDYVIYIVDSILFTDDQEIKVAVDYDTDDAIEFVIENEANKLKINAYRIILNQYGDKQITIALKRQIWKDIVYTVSDYYIYLNDNWYVFDEDTHDAVCPVPASLDYICETMKAYYQVGGLA